MAFSDGIGWVCIGSLFVGFAWLQGLLARASRSRRPWSPHPVLSLAFALAVILPASVLVTAMPGLSWPPRLAILSLGAGSALIAYLRPHSLPAVIWSPFFGRLYLGATMGSVALWGLLLATRTTPSGLVGAASIVACLVTTLPVSRLSQSPHAFDVE